MIHHLPRRFEALSVSCRAIQLDERPHRVLLPPDVEAAVLLGIGRFRVHPQEIPVGVRGKVSVGVLVGVDEMMSLLHAP